MKKIALILASIFLLSSNFGFACDLCKKNQPKGLENITHGNGPSGTIDYFIIWSAIIIVGITMFLSIKYLIKPKENNPGHIKNIVKNEGF